MHGRYLASAATTAVTGLLVAGLSASPASAASRTWTCQDGGHTLTTNVYYTQDSTKHTWQYLTYKLTGAGTGGKSNWNASFNDGTGTRNYAENDTDNLDNNTLYTEDFVNFTSRLSLSEKWTASAAFDTRGTDNHCTSSTIF